MRNFITASVEFYFKGEKYASVIEFDLDEHMSTTGSVPDFQALLARNMKLGVYTYEYEMLLAEPISFSHAQGIAADHLHENNFNFETFEQAWMERKVNLDLQAVALEHLSITDLENQPELKKALLAAHKLGEKFSHEA